MTGKRSRLADALKAKTIVAGEIKLGAEPWRFDVKLGTHIRGTRNGDDHSWIAGKSVTWAAIAYSDELPPETALAPLLAPALPQLGFAVKPTIANPPCPSLDEPRACPRLERGTGSFAKGGSDRW